MTTMTTVGYGDISARSDVERGYVIFVMVRVKARARARVVARVLGRVRVSAFAT